MRKVLCLVLIVLLSLSLTAGLCLAQAKKSYTFGFVPGIITNPFYISMHYGAKTAADQLGVKLIWQGPQNWDFAQQTVVVDALVSKGVSALILSPCDPEALKGPLQKAVQAGILVITTDTDINDPEAKIRATNVASNNYLGGLKAGEALAKAIGNKGEVALMGAMTGVTTNEDRYKGFKEVMAKYPDIKIVATEYSNSDQSKAAQQMQSVILAHPNLVGAFGVDTPTAHGCAIGIRNAGAKGKVKLVAFDAQPLEVEDLKEGLTSMLVAQAPYAMGYLGVQFAYDYLEGFVAKFPGNFTTGYYIITPENVNDPETKKWVYQTEPPK